MKSWFLVIRGFIDPRRDDEIRVKITPSKQDLAELKRLVAHKQPFSVIAMILRRYTQNLPWRGRESGFEDSRGNQHDRLTSGGRMTPWSCPRGELVTLVTSSLTQED